MIFFRAIFINMNNLIEEWKVLEGINEKFAISNYGRKKNLKNGYISKPTKTYGIRKGIKGGEYFYYKISKKKYYVHRLVAIYFIKNSNTTKNHVNHIDGNTFNNYASNLEWVNFRENTHYRFRKNRNSIKSKYIGVYRKKLDYGKIWCSQISINGRTQCLGWFDTEIEAYEAYKAKSLEIGREILEIK